jgi:uncharacterized protein (TIGR03086 family)
LSQPDLRLAAEEVARLADGVRDDQLRLPTPSPGRPVAGLLDHLLGLADAFTCGARKVPPAGGPRADAENLDPAWRATLPARVRELAEAWRDPQAWEGTTEVGGVTLPAAQMGVVALGELVLHGWDLARATGQELRCDPASAEAVLGLTAATPDDPASREGLFGPVVAVPEDASTLDRALGYAGRDPAWTADQGGTTGPA